MTASSLLVLAETVACRFSTTSNKFWLICGGMSLILVVEASVKGTTKNLSPT
jgi:hypothetical protein